MKGSTKVQYRCSFCGKAQEQVSRLIAGPGGVYICNECISLCQEIIDEEQATQARREAQSGRDDTERGTSWRSGESVTPDATLAAQLAPLTAELAEARATIERLARDNGALRERLRALGEDPG